MCNCGGIKRNMRQMMWIRHHCKHNVPDLNTHVSIYYESGWNVPISRDAWSKTETHTARRPATLTFNQENWNTYQTAAVRADVFDYAHRAWAMSCHLIDGAPTAQSDDEKLEHYFGPEYLRTRLHVNQSLSNLPLATRGHVERVWLPYGQVANA